MMAAAVTTMILSILISCALTSTQTVNAIRLHSDVIHEISPSIIGHHGFLPSTMISIHASTCRRHHSVGAKARLVGDNVRTTCTDPSASLSFASAGVPFGIPRGGGSGSGEDDSTVPRNNFFGRKRGRGDKRKSSRHRRSRRHRHGGGGGDDDDSEKIVYPALTRDEIVDKLNVPVFAITDYNGNGAVLAHNETEESSSDISINTLSGGVASIGEGSVYLFLSRPMAQNALKKIQQANKGVNLKVSALHLGKVWFNLIHKDHGDVSVTKVDSLNDEDGPKTTTKKIHFRIVPGIRDLVGARFLLGMKQPDDFETLRNAMEQSDTEKAKEVVQKIVERSPGFRAPYNEIPVFLMSQMRIQRKHNPFDDTMENISSETKESPTPMLPLFLSPKTMIDAYFHFLKTSPEFRNMQPTLQLVELHKIVEMMQQESEMDFRNVVLFPAATYDMDNTNMDDDDESDDDNDGGGGDNALEKNTEEESGEVDYSPTVECMPFVSMEMNVFDTEGGNRVGQSPNLVPLY